MSRRKRVLHKEVKTDLRYASPLVARLVTSIMRCGKRSVAEKIVYTAIETTRSSTEVVDPLDVLQKAIENIRPRLEVKSRRVGGATYQVPMEVALDRSHALAMRWLVTFAKKRKGIPMAKALANELKDASMGQGAAIKKRDDLHKMAQANRAFAHFRW
ncbi:MAG: 30S ribosomal protein S7 [Chthoniobacterales bacterium]|nr:30S ribosomal protein S7 [Chthoniobacterales bacterium]